MTLFRTAPVRIYYGPNRSAAVYDEYAIAVAVAAGMLGLAWFAVWPTCKRKRNTLLVNAAYAMGIFVFVVAILGLTCKSWQSGTLYTSAPYAPYSAGSMNGTVGLYMGLNSFNVTLRGDPEWQHTAGADGVLEQINYNEIIPFGERQGRTGFGEYANTVNRAYRRMQGRGLPYPIAWVVELFTNDGDGLRWGRYHRQAGYYAHVLLWASIPVWILTLAAFAAGLWGIAAGGIRTGKAKDAAHGGALYAQTGNLSRAFLLKSQLRPASLLCMCTGLLQLGAPCIYAVIIALAAGPPVCIHFTSGSLVLHYGWIFWLTLANGAVILSIGIAGTVWCHWRYAEDLQRLECVWEDERQAQAQLAEDMAAGGTRAHHVPKHSRSASRQSSLRHHAQAPGSHTRAPSSGIGSPSPQLTDSSLQSMRSPSDQPVQSQEAKHEIEMITRRPADYPSPLLRASAGSPLSDVSEGVQPSPQHETPHGQSATVTPHSHAGATALNLMRPPQLLTTPTSATGGLAGPGSVGTAITPSPHPTARMAPLRSARVLESIIDADESAAESPLSFAPNPLPQSEYSVASAIPTHGGEPLHPPAAGASARPLALSASTPTAAHLPLWSSEAADTPQHFVYEARTLDATSQSPTAAQNDAAGPSFHEEQA